MTSSPTAPHARRHLRAVRPTHRSPGRLSLRLDGELDVSRVDEILGPVSRGLAEGHRVVELDLADVTFMDCATIGALITCAREARAVGGHLQVSAASAPARRVIELTGTGDALGLRAAA